MFKRTVSIIIQTLLLISMLALAFKILPVKANGTIYIRADGSIDPPTAPIQRNGNIYTLNGNITGGIVIERDNTVLDGAGYTLLGSGEGEFGFSWLVVNNVTIKNTNIQKFRSGIYFYVSSNNTISGNNITNNIYAGIGFGESSNNKIFHNNFVNNSNQVFSIESVSIWDDGYPSGGNYWSSYTGVDNYSGPYQNETGSDGIGDTPVQIDQYNKDNYPLMSPWPRRDIAIINVTLSTNEAYAGQTVEINVVIKNWGGLPETFNVIVYYDDTTIETREISGLAPDTETSLTFNWNTTEVSGGYYTISANTSTIAGEIYTTNNAFANGVIKITSPVRIVEVIPCDQSGYPKETFIKGTIAFFKVTINSTALKPQDTLITIILCDNCYVPIGLAAFLGPILLGISTIMFGLPIPTTAFIGTATVYANCFTDWPSQGGFPHCPEISATLEIKGP